MKKRKNALPGCLVMGCLMLFGQVSGQQVQLKVTGRISSDSSLANVSFSIHSVSKALLLGYQQTSAPVMLGMMVTCDAGDTLELRVTHSIFITESKLIPVSGTDSIDFGTIKLSKKILELTDFKVRSPSRWTRGDTTFYKVDSFTDGSERKLIDVIRNMPGFTLLDDGTLLFQRKPVDRILVEGEELMADQVQLLLKNIPSHILNTIQAIENQNKNKLLKGLAGDGRVFINLTLKDRVNPKIFGDLEAGITQDKRYNLAPTLFSITPKVKYAIIGQYNSLGFGSAEAETRENARYFQPVSENLIKISSLQHSPELNFGQVASTRLFSTKAQVNFHYNKRLPVKIEIGDLRDVQRQRLSSESLIFTADSLLRRREIRSQSYSPKVSGFSHELTFIVDSTSEIKTWLSMYLERTTGETAAELVQNDSIFSVRNNMKNDWLTAQLEVEYTKRISPEKARILNINFSQYELPQSIHSVSPDWPRLFQSPDVDLRTLVNGYNSRASRASGEYTAFRRTTKGNRKLLFGMTTEQFRPKSTVFLQSETNTSKFDLSFFSARGAYRSSKLYASHNWNFRIRKQPAQLISTGGLSENSQNENGQVRKFVQPFFLFIFSHNQKHSKNVTDSWILAATQEPRSFMNLNNLFLPRGLVFFNRSANINLPLRQFRANYSLNWSTSSFVMSTTSFSYIRNFTSSVFYPSFLSNAQLSSDSTTHRSTSFLQGSSDLTFPFLWLRTKVRIGIEASGATRLLLLDRQIVNATIRSRGVFLELKRNFRKRFFITYNLSLNKLSTQTPINQNARDFNSVLDLTNKLTLRHTVTKKIEWRAEAVLLDNNLKTNLHRSHFLTNFESSFLLGKKQTRGIIRAINLSNLRSYRRMDVYEENIQSVTTVELQPLAIYFAVRWQF